MFSHFRLARDATRAPNPRISRWLDTGFAALPAPWRVLRNRRARATDGPPWVKYIALHPEKGIALVDALPANPETAVAPLAEFLIGTGFAAFSHGDPPIVALALAERDIASIGGHLTDAFAGGPPCGIKNTNWTEAVIDLLMSTPELLLTPIKNTSDTPRRTEAAPVKQASHVGSEPIPNLASAAPKETRPPTARPPTEFVQPPRSRRASSAGPVLLEAPDPELRFARPPPRDHGRQARWSFALWLAAAALGTGTVAGLLYTHSPGTGPITTASTDTAPAQAADQPPLSAVSPKTDSAQPAVPAPDRGSSPPVAALPAQPAPSQPPVAIAPQSPKTTPEAPRALPAPKMRTRQSAALSPPARDSAGPDLNPPPEHRAGKAEPRLRLHLPGTGSEIDSGPATSEAPPVTREDTVTIDGTTYIRGREPRPLGTVTPAEPEPRSESGSDDSIDKSVLPPP